MRPALAVLLLCVCGAAAAASPPALSGRLIYVCGVDLCRSTAGAGATRLTRDGSRAAYSRPSVSVDGRRIAFKRGDPGRVYTALVTVRGLRQVRRIPAAPGGPRDATQYDVAIAPDGRHVAWVEHRINVVVGGVDYRRYVADFDGANPRQVASNGGRPFVTWFDNATIVREGFPPPVPPGAPVDAGLCVPDPATKTNGVCGRSVARDPRVRHLRHPSVSPQRDRVVATASVQPDEIDDAPDHPGAIVLFDARSGAWIRDLTKGPNDRDPEFSPDGSTVAFVRRGSLYTVPVSGGTARRVVARGVQPTWSR